MLCIFVEYQINTMQLIVITAVSVMFFYIDYKTNARPVLNFIYTVALPIVFFYMKYTPKENLEEEPA